MNTEDKLERARAALAKCRQTRKDHAVYRKEEGGTDGRKSV